MRVPNDTWRYTACAMAIMALFAVMAWQSWQLQTVVRDNLSAWGSKYQQRVHSIGARRGAITDRNGQPLAVSSKVYSIGVDPRFFAAAEQANVRALASALELASEHIENKLAQNRRRSFFYLRRHISPARKRAVTDLGLKGVIVQEEHKRFYPDRESFANVIGVTNIDDRGVEGLELAFDEWLGGQAGEQRFIRDNRGRVIEDLGVIKEPKPGRDLRLTLDRRLQHFAYTELQKTVAEHKALSGSMVIVDTAGAEILAMVNVPSFNPNSRQTMTADRMRNRAAVDVFEPGSTVKPLTVAAALDSGLYQTGTVIDIGNGKLQVGEFTISDVSTSGLLTVAEVLKFSSNVGAGTIAMRLGAERIWQNLLHFGFGRITHSGFPGESPGVLQPHARWPESVVATHGYGYGLSVTLLQLARAYTVIAAGGLDRPLTFQISDADQEPVRVIPAAVAQQILHILGEIVRDGNGRKAQISGYSAGGKTGTSRKFDSTGGYSNDRYNSMFVGISPVTAPRIVCAIVIDEPQGQYYGGEVAAPLFARVVSVALRLLGIPADRVGGRGV
ncbi:MAG: penicillin-binding protein 2 [Proteobacteria bacterium]|nr:penicillin-binding protein 2 [Pseudomonadota bacterium]